MTCAQPIRRAVVPVLFIAALLAPAGTAWAVDPVFSTFFGGAIRGYDPVAYHTEGKPVAGKRAHRVEWKGATWSFASAENKALFEGDPEKYAPRYGGYCAWAVEQRRHRLHRPGRLDHRGRQALPQLQPGSAGAVVPGHPRQHRQGRRQLAQAPGGRLVSRPVSSRHKLRGDFLSSARRDDL